MDRSMGSPFVSRSISEEKVLVHMLVMTEWTIKENPCVKRLKMQELWYWFKSEKPTATRTPIFGMTQRQ